MDKGTLIFIIAVAVILSYIVRFKLLNKGAKRSGFSGKSLPLAKVENDKIVLVNDLTKTDIKTIINGFCKMYNKDSYQALPRLYALSDKQFAITFPFDIELNIYGFFVNYVNYPMDFNRSIDVTAWMTIGKSGIWTTEKTLHKKVMLYIPTDDTDYDNVYLTTSDNIGYKLGFALGEERQLLDFPKRSFEEPKVRLEELKDKEFEDFK